MRRHDVELERLLFSIERRSQLRGPPQRRQEARSAKWVEARPRDDADAGGVGVELLLTGEACDREPLAGPHLVAFLAVLNDGGGLRDDRRLSLAFGAQRAVAKRNMGDFVGHHRRRLGRVTGEHQESAGDVKIAGRQRKGVDDRGVEDRHLVGRLAGRIADGRQFDENGVEITLCGGRFIFAAKLGDELLMLDRAAIIGSRRRRPGRRRRRRKEMSLPLQFCAAAQRQRDDGRSQRGRRPPSE